MPIYLMLKFTDISWGKIHIFYRPAYIYMYRVYNTKKLSKPFGLIESNAIIFNSFISDWAGPHNQFWASANVKIKLD